VHGTRARLLTATLAALLAAPALAAQPAATRHTTTSSWKNKAALRVTATDDGYPELDLSLDLADDAGAPGRITIYVPRGFAIYPDRPPGSAVGHVEISAQDASYGTSTQTTLAGSIVAQPPPTTPPACAPDPPIGVWQLQLSLLGQALEVPMYLSQSSAGDPPGTASTITLCAPALPATDPASARALPIATLDLALTDLEAPRARGAYLWRALVTPLAPDRRTLRSDHAYEIRALTPVPHLLTLTGRYLPDKRLVLLQGRLTASGTPRAGVRIRFVELIRHVTPTGSVVRDRIAGWAKTGRFGGYTFRTPLRATTSFIAIAEPSTAPCHGPRIAPGGCLSTTLPATQSEPATISAPPAR
jgi:hypothetical protein